MTLKFNRVRAVVKVHDDVKYHQAECSGSWVIVLRNCFALSRKVCGYRLSHVDNQDVKQLKRQRTTKERRCNSQ